MTLFLKKTKSSYLLIYWVGLMGVVVRHFEMGYRVSRVRDITPGQNSSLRTDREVRQDERGCFLIEIESHPKGSSCVSVSSEVQITNVDHVVLKDRSINTSVNGTVVLPTISGNT